ncbi:MAG: glycosyl transferase [Mycobacterium sp.]|nr:glycosyl transferase [Mycobacterium sp.]
MRILHDTDAYLPRLGGIEMHVHDLARAQTAAGDQVDILSMTAGRGAIDSPASAGVIRPKDGSGWVGKGRFLARNRTFGVDHGYDIVHAHCSTISPLAFFAFGTPGVPRLMTLHSMWQRYTPLYRGFDTALHWSSWPVKFSAVSQVAADGMRNAARTDLDVAVLPNGIDLDLWTPGLRTSEPQHLRILAVMRLSTRKRPLTLLRILKSVRSRVPADIKLTATILGEGPSRGQMEHYLSRHAMSDWVHLPGHLPRTEVRQMMAHSDVFVAPAKLESFGIAALEAHAAGLPVVGRSGNGLSEFMRDGEGGVLVDSDREMSAVLAQMATERTHESVPRSSSLETFSWPNVVQLHRDLYEEAGAAVRRPQVTRVS